jgi:hypothetical protein
MAVVSGEASRTQLPPTGSPIAIGINRRLAAAPGQDRIQQPLTWTQAPMFRGPAVEPDRDLNFT